MNWLDYILLFLPELILLVALIKIIILQVASFQFSRTLVLSGFSATFLIISVATMLFGGHGEFFGGMFIATEASQVQKSILLLATFLLSLQAWDWLKNHRHYYEFFMLLFSVLLGMFLMLSAGHFLTLYIGLELATIPLAALAAFDTNRAQSGEAGTKLILSSAFSSALLLLGLSFIYGMNGSMYFNEVGIHFHGQPLELLGFTLLLAGFAFKISIVPFHLWTADVYQGSPVSITAFLSVVSKGAAVFALLNVLYKVFQLIAGTWMYVLALLSVITMITGNLFALRQTNLKRFLAFSSITQAGYILIGALAADKHGMASIMFFVLIYVFSNLGAFSVVSAVSRLTGKESLSDLRGLYYSNPKTSLVLVLALLSLAGIPPVAGFTGKWFLLSAGMHSGMMWLIIIAAINLVVSLYYYLRLAGMVFMGDQQDALPAFSLSIPEKLGMVICTAGVLLLGLIGFVYEYFYNLSM